MAVDDLPMWSAPFGMMVLREVRMAGVRAVLDVGCGTGFPVVELAERYGAGVRVVGLDPWERGLERARKKVAVRGIKNLELVCGDALSMPFEDASFDLITSNNGINNISDQPKALAECRRVATAGAQLVLTVNLPDTMREFYAVLVEVLRGEGGDGVERMRAHIQEKRKPSAETQAMVEAAGFRVVRSVQEEFSLRYASGTAFLDHWFVRIGFAPAWRAILPAERVDPIFLELRRRLDAKAAAEGGLSMTVPMLCLVAECATQGVRG